MHNLAIAELRVMSQHVDVIEKKEAYVLFQRIYCMHCGIQSMFLSLSKDA